ncbi:YCF48-related protein [Paenibacillus sp. VCA1]|uniref:WD40/YVTN/BNR-like repeat-containing protein n=1 Tax=Paenibacillus sp. VCA1 TaxID=3039148 RepID=UPI002871E6BC|nr:YCF48-related protein [Paenibacillus sp. VCA1]MDR9854169.1 YCF48-related protein [Paenibacillus sp. VCA1]
MSWRKPLFGIALLCCLLLSACSSGEEHTAAPASAPTVQDSAEPAAGEGQTLTVVAPSAENKVSPKNDAGKYKIQTKLTDFQLLSETQGIAWGLTRNELRLYLTEDNGRTWVNISPSANVQFPANPKYGKDIYFTDPMHGWIVRDPSGMSETIVLHTSDGGETWSISSIPQKNRVSALNFDSPLHGVMMTTEEASTGKELKVLYRTDDGGAVWNVAMQNTVYDPGKSGAGSPIPHLGYTVGLNFRDSLNGFVMVQELGEPKLYRTKDGGKKWIAGPSIFDREKLKPCVSYAAGNLEFFGASRQEGWIPIGCRLGESTKYNGYFTKDGGETWTFANFALQASEGLNQSLRPSFINASEGWALVGSTLYHTVDQGKAWSAMAGDEALKEKLKQYPEVVKLQFSSPTVGWLLIGNNEQKSSRLLQTTDGGVTWRVL